MSTNSIEVPVKLRDGNLMVTVRVNQSDPLTFKVDTGFGVSTIHPDLVESLGLTRAGHMLINGIAGQENADTFRGAVFDFGGKTYEPRRVAVLPSDGHRRWRRRDGILGAGFFHRFVVEIDDGGSKMVLHEPKTFSYSGNGEVFPLEFKTDTPIISSAILLRGKGAKPIDGRFEIDTGCDDCVCLGHEFVEANRLIELGGEGDGSARRGVGGTAEIQRTKLAELRMGKLTVQGPSANFFLEGSPAGDGQAGHIGLGALQRYKIIFDYSRKQMILEQPEK